MGKLTIQEIAKVLVAKNNLEQSEANRFATEMFAVIQERLEKNDQVKVKGLGTWKVITVDARESISVQTGDRVIIEEHAKITFTPDATMKELVNKPFSQFETVVLNDNVQFDDMSEQPADSDSEVEGSLDEVAEPLAEVEVPSAEAAEPQAEVEVPSVEVAEPQAEAEGDADEEPELEESSSSGLKWLWMILGLLAVAAVSALGGYYYGSRYTEPKVLVDTVIVRDTVYIADSPDTTAIDTLAQQPKEAPAQQPKDAPVQQPKVEPAQQPKVEPAQQSKVEPDRQSVDQYAEKDERIRFGAYRIVGLDHEVKVLQGQTFYSICRAHLGPDMECYVEAYNDLPRNPQVKAGQVIKIPKLQLKKRKKQ